MILDPVILARSAESDPIVQADGANYGPGTGHPVA